MYIKRNDCNYRIGEILIKICKWVNMQKNALVRCIQIQGYFEAIKFTLHLLTMGERNVNPQINRDVPQIFNSPFNCTGSGFGQVVR